MKEPNLPFIHIQEIDSNSKVEYGSNYERRIGSDEWEIEMNRMLHDYGFNSWHTNHWVHIDNKGLFRYRTVKNINMIVTTYYTYRYMFFKHKKYIKIELKAN